MNSTKLQTATFSVSNRHHLKARTDSGVWTVLVSEALRVSAWICHIYSHPPEAHINNECDENHSAGRHFSIGGASVEVLGIAAVLLRQAGQITSFGIQSCRKNRQYYIILLQIQMFFSCSNELKILKPAAISVHSPDNASPRWSTSSILATMILCTSCNSELMLPRFLRALLSM